MSRAARSGFLALAAALVAALLFAYWYSKTADRRAVRELPDEERHALYLHVLDGFERYCWSPVVAPNGWCREQALFLQQFPECEARCAQIVRRYIIRATR